MHGLINTLQHKAYLEMPMSTLYLFGSISGPFLRSRRSHHGGGGETSSSRLEVARDRQRKDPVGRVIHARYWL